MKNFTNFIFKDYAFNPITKSLNLYYSYDGLVDFVESYRFDFDFVEYDQSAFEKAVFSLFIMAGVSYYKCYLAPKIVIDKGSLSSSEASFFQTVYQKGLGEFFYKNNLDPKTEINFPVDPVKLTKVSNLDNTGLLIGIGGGKDSIVTTEILKDSKEDVATWSLGHIDQLEPLVAVLGMKHYFVLRQWDSSLLKHNDQGAYNGHIPISAIIAFVGAIVAILSGRGDIVVSNEYSADEPNLSYKGVDINHQYSKSSEFELAFQKYLKNDFGDSIRYYSFLRPLSELHISQLFGTKYFDKYSKVFSSCNNAFTHSRDTMYWCCECPKCAFVFLALTPFVDRSKLEGLFGKNLLLEPNLEMIYMNLLGISGDKPLECVGEIRESRMAMKLAQSIYPELSKYRFFLPKDYNYKSLSINHMPKKQYQLLLNSI
ncbi:MAG TPA: hypothetical protein VMR76_01685 [Candidatus Saccharimonadia bacterium]|nr:hypothetical protein [Candidatus Saccharimonadia bacterium]